MVALESLTAFRSDLSKVAWDNCETDEHMYGLV